MKWYKTFKKGNAMFQLKHHSLIVEQLAPCTSHFGVIKCVYFIKVIIYTGIYGGSTVIVMPYYHFLTNL